MSRLRPGTRFADFPTMHEASPNSSPADRVLALQEKLQDLISDAFFFPPSFLSILTSFKRIKS